MQQAGPPSSPSSGWSRPRRRSHSVALRVDCSNALSGRACYPSRSDLGTAGPPPLLDAQKKPRRGLRPSIVVDRGYRVADADLAAVCMGRRSTGRCRRDQLVQRRSSGHPRRCSVRASSLEDPLSPRHAACHRGDLRETASSPNAFVIRSTCGRIGHTYIAPPLALSRT